MKLDIEQLEKIILPKKIYNLYYQRPIVGFSIDSRTIKENQVFIAIKGKYNDGHNYIKEAVEKKASAVIAELDIANNFKVPFFVVDNTYLVLEKLISYIRKQKNPFVFAITGSVGKTTTKEMLSFLLEKDYKILKSQKTENNLLGVAKTFFSFSDEKIVVLELGTNSKGEIQKLSELVLPDVGVITFIKPVHLEGLGSLREIFIEKTSLLKSNPKIIGVLNKDDKYLRRVDFCKRIHWFGKNRKADLFARFIKYDNNYPVFRIQDKFNLILKNEFKGFIYNALAAILAASLLDIPISVLVERLNSFDAFVESRMQMYNLNDYFILNDAYNANPYSFKEALKLVRRYPHQKIAIIADMLELGKKSIYYHRLLAKDILKSNFNYCLAIGDFTIYTVEELKRLGYKYAFHFQSHEKLALFLKEIIKKGWLIFLKGSRKMELEKIIEFLKN